MDEKEYNDSDQTMAAKYELYFTTVNNLHTINQERKVWHPSKGIVFLAKYIVKANILECYPYGTQSKCIIKSHDLNKVFKITHPNVSFPTQPEQAENRECPKIVCNAIVQSFENYDIINETNSQVTRKLIANNIVGYLQFALTFFQVTSTNQITTNGCTHNMVMKPFFTNRQRAHKYFDSLNNQTIDLEFEPMKNHDTINSNNYFRCSLYMIPKKVMNDFNYDYLSKATFLNGTFGPKLIASTSSTKLSDILSINTTVNTSTVHGIPSCKYGNLDSCHDSSYRWFKTTNFGPIVEFGGGYCCHDGVGDKELNFFNFRDLKQHDTTQFWPVFLLEIVGSCNCS